ncbi:MAG: hypothetical protein AUJ08_03595 [Thaumarchaeota archaeon 13_1_40CM_3_50_5]|nr:MAG: hypothetical protein AUH71_00910 [Thaumarchaeota archaeon 13_1_40CM_4_48_7]OLC84908.1 MAG: hypothetical protein AUJ08_03595 [Thaumarchaeota archaeon 13_1_40CM_3_50_5]
MIQLAHTVTGHDNVKLLAFMIGAAVFFVVTLFLSFFIVIVAINNANVSAEDAPNMFMLGLIPPSIGTFLLFTKVFGRFL